MKYVPRIRYGGELMHYRTKGSINGVRRYQNKDGSLTPAGYAHYGVDRNYWNQFNQGSGRTATYNPNASGAARSGSPYSSSRPNYGGVSSEYLRENAYNSQRNTYPGQQQASAGGYRGGSNNRQYQNGGGNSNRQSSGRVSSEYEQERAYNSQRNNFSSAQPARPKNTVTSYDTGYHGRTALATGRGASTSITRQNMRSNIAGAQPRAAANAKPQGNSFMRGILNGAKSAGNWLSDRGNDAVTLAKGAGKAASNAYNSAKNWAGDRVNDIGKAASDVGVGARNAFDRAKNWAGDRVDAAGTTVRKALDGGRASTNSSGKQMADSMRESARNLKEGADRYVDRMRDLSNGNESADSIIARNRERANRRAEANKWEQQADQWQEGYDRSLMGRTEGARKAAGEALNSAKNWAGDRVNDIGKAASNARDFITGDRSKQRLDAAEEQHDNQSKRSNMYRNMEPGWLDYVDEQNNERNRENRIDASKAIRRSQAAGENARNARITETRNVNNWAKDYDNITQRDIQDERERNWRRNRSGVGLSRAQNEARINTVEANRQAAQARRDADNAVKKYNDNKARGSAERQQAENVARVNIVEENRRAAQARRERDAAQAAYDRTIPGMANRAANAASNAFDNARDWTSARASDIAGAASQAGSRARNFLDDLIGSNPFSSNNKKKTSKGPSGGYFTLDEATGQTVYIDENGKKHSK